jgi:DNA-binding transcriptional regulator YhcF (GntR family)
VKTSKTDEKLIIKARTMYVFGIERDGKHILPSIRDVARALGLNFRTLQERAVKEKWHEERTRTYRAISKEVKNRLMAEYVESNFKIRSSMVEACLLGVKLIQSRLAQVAVAAREQGVSAVPTKQAAVQSWEMQRPCRSSGNAATYRLRRDGGRGCGEYHDLAGRVAAGSW